MLQNIDKKGLDVKELFNDYSNEDTVVNVVSLRNYRDSEYIYFFTSNGFIKKTSCSEFEGEFENGLACKLKGDEDKVIFTSLEETESHVLLVTRKAMCIRFAGETVNPMGRNASGVTAISLKEDDEVVFAQLLQKEEDSAIALDEVSIDKQEGTLNLNTSKGDIKPVEINSITVQNRAGRGKNIMLFLDDDYVEKVEIS
jgi:topoisomerase-4 subunit A